MARAEQTRGSGGDDHVATTNRQYAVALSRGFAGATIFCLPLLLTMEMWWLGFTLDPAAVLQFSIVNLVLLYGLSHVAGFEESHNWLDDVLDAFAAYAVAAIVVTVILALAGVIDFSTPFREASGKIAVQAVPASFGAMIGAKLMGEGEAIERQEHWRDTYSGELFLMAAGALFLSFTTAPTEEVILVAFQITPWHGLAIVAASILLIHAIFYVAGFSGQQRRAIDGLGQQFLRHTLPGYGIAVAVSFYILWTFGRTAGLDPSQVAMAVAVLAFPASIGVGISRVVI